MTVAVALGFGWFVLFPGLLNPFLFFPLSLVRADGHPPLLFPFPLARSAEKIF